MLILVSFVYAYICQDETDVSDIPCDIITPVMTCGNYTYNVTYTATGAVVQEGNLTAVSDGTYKFVFTQTYGNYNVFVCENSSIWGSINIGDYADETRYEYWGVVFLLIFCWVGFVVGLTFNNYPLSAIFSFLLMILGVYIMTAGLLSIENWVTDAFAIIQICIGGYVLIVWTWEEYKDL